MLAFPVAEVVREVQKADLLELGRAVEDRAVLDSIADKTGITERATLYSSTEFKKVRLLYFTDEFKAWEREHAGV